MAVRRSRGLNDHVEVVILSPVCRCKSTTEDATNPGFNHAECQGSQFGVILQKGSEQMRPQLCKTAKKSMGCY